MDDCKFCEAMKIYKQMDAFDLRKGIRRKYSVAIVSRSHYDGRRGYQSGITDYRYRGCGYALNFCPECGRRLKKYGSPAKERM